MKNKKELNKKDKKNKDRRYNFLSAIVFIYLVIVLLIAMPIITQMFYNVEHEKRLNEIQEDYLDDKYRIELMKSMQPSNLDECVRGCEIVAKILMDGSTFGYGNFNSYKCYEYCLKDKVNTE